MGFFNALAILISLAAIFGYINHRFLKLPSTIGVMLISLILSLLIVASGEFAPELFKGAKDAVIAVDFSDFLMEVMLSFLLFAGALHVDIKTLAAERNPIIFFSTIGVVLSTFLIGTIMYFVFSMLGIGIDYIYCLIFGSLISPTDPIAVLAILKQAGVPKNLEVKITGESLFNDGVAVVVFISLFGIAQKGIENVTAADVAILFAQEAVGGILLGFAIGYVGYYLMKSIDAYIVEVLISLAVVMGGYAFATYMHMSGPLSVVVAGLIIGTQGRNIAMSDLTREYLDKFWEMIDEVLNAILFVLIGLEVLVITFEMTYLVAGLIAIVVALAVRLIAVGLPISLMKLRREFVPNTIMIMTWGGLRGGISVALALSLTAAMPRDLIVTVTYVVVIFSIVVQGLSIGKLVKYSKNKALRAEQ
ncbi:MAG: sodium:proton antiporter [Bernardetiaceae bacterium]|nr:sodium:proton antiporter [Bernardetiaceae bacterium]